MRRRAMSDSFRSRAFRFMEKGVFLAYEMSLLRIYRQQSRRFTAG